MMDQDYLKSRIALLYTTQDLQIAPFSFKIDLVCIKNAEETLTGQCLWLTGWRPCIWNMLHTLDYLFPRFKILHSW